MLLALIAIFAPLIAPFAPDHQEFADYLLPPSADHWFGTDEQGRDQFSRVIFGSRVSLLVGIISVSIGCFFGLLFGITAGYYGSWPDMIIMRFMDILLAFPSILLALTVVAILGPAMFTVMVAVGISTIPLFTRVARSSVLSAKEAEYVMAAHVTGAPPSRIMLRHILPNSLAPVMVMATTGIASAIITGAALSYLGLGVQPPTPEWGSMLSSSRRFLRHAAWMMVFPGLAITITVISINLLGDGLRDAFDPRLKE